MYVLTDMGILWTCCSLRNSRVKDDYGYVAFVVVTIPLPFVFHNPHLTREIRLMPLVRQGTSYTPRVHAQFYQMSCYVFLKEMVFYQD